MTNEAAVISPAKRRKAVVAATIGNALEFYDFLIFALFAIQIGETFFPSGNAYASLMASLATFGAGFVTRPIGAWVIGSYADRKGRRPALMLSMVLMGAGICGIALLPGYNTIGMAAPILAVTARLVQGFALGGEVGPSTAYLLENADHHRRGVVMSMQRFSQLFANVLGAFVGLVLSLVLSKADFDAYGWRIALMLGALIIPYALYIRRDLPETMDANNPAPEPEPAVPQSIRRTMFLSFLIITAGTIGSYVSTYMTTYGQATLKLSATVSMAGQFLANSIAMVTCLVAGAWSDRIGRRPLVIWGYGVSAVIAVLIFPWMAGSPGALSFIVSNVLFASANSAAVAPGMAAIAESLPKGVRARNFAMVYALPVAILGGTTQMVVTWLIHVTGDPMAVTWYPIAAMLLGTIAAFAFRESAPRKVLTEPSVA